MATAVEAAQGWQRWFNARPKALEAARAAGMPWGWNTYEEMSAGLARYFQQYPSIQKVLNLWDAMDSVSQKAPEAWTAQDRDTAQVMARAITEGHLTRRPEVAAQLGLYKEPGETWADVVDRSPEIVRDFHASLLQSISGAQTAQPQPQPQPDEEDDRDKDYGDPEVVQAELRGLKRQVRGHVDQFTNELTRQQQEYQQGVQTAIELQKIRHELQEIRDEDLYKHTKYTPTVDPGELAQFMLANNVRDTRKALELMQAPQQHELGRQQGRAEADQARWERGETSGANAKSYTRKVEQQRAEARAAGTAAKRPGQTMRPASEVLASVKDKLAARGIVEEEAPTSRDQMVDMYRERQATEPSVSGEPSRQPVRIAQTFSQPAQPAAEGSESAA